MTDAVLNPGMLIRPLHVPPSAWIGHIPFAGWLMEALRPSIFVELGTHHGTSYLSFCQTVSQRGLGTACYAVDTWEGDDHTQSYGDETFIELQAYHDLHYSAFSHLLRTTFSDALQYFDDGSVDLLHIDGFHTYEAVEQDFESWLPKLSTSGIVLFHDTMERERGFGVWKFWAEVSKKYPSFEFKHSHGLGVLLVGKEVPADVTAMMSPADAEDVPVVGQLFATLGSNIQLSCDIAWWKAEVGKLGSRLAEGDSRTSQLVQQLAAQQAEAENVARLVAERQATIKALENSTSERDGRISHLLEQRTDLEAQLTTALQLEGQLAAQVTKAEDMARQVAERQAKVEALESSASERDVLISHLLEQRTDLQTQLTTPGYRIGRKLDQFRARFAPAGTRRGNLIRLVGKGVETLVQEGAGAASQASYRHLAWRVRGKHGAPTGRYPLLGGTVANGTGVLPRQVQADHPGFAGYIAANEPNGEQLDVQRVSAGDFGYQPVISVIVPVYRVPIEVMEETIACLEAQTYPNWQGCLVWSDIDDVAGWGWLQARTAGDARFRVELLKENGGISRNSNAALELADGEYLALLDHDDTIAPWAFFEVVKLLQADPHLDFIYSDKDSISADGSLRLNALFKPSWSPEMLHSVNYLTHLNVMRTALVREIGGWNAETDGAQDWDIFFRLTERTSRIARIDTILYHWRILPTSTATGLQAKPYAALGQLRSQQDHFKRQGLPASVVPTQEGLFHVQWPETPQSTDVVVFQSGSTQQLVNVLDGLRACKQAVIRRVIVVARDSQASELQAFQQVWGARFELVERQSPDWRNALAATTAEHSADVVLLLDGRVDSISETLPGELSGWVGHHPDIAWVSAVVIGVDGLVYEAGRVVGHDDESAPMFRGSPLHSFGWFGGPLWYRNATAASPYAIAMGASAVADAVGQLPDGYIPFAALCRMLVRNGRRGLINPHARIHLRQNLETTWANEGDLYKDDAYFHPAFSGVSPLSLRQ